MITFITDQQAGEPDILSPVAQSGLPTMTIAGYFVDWNGDTRRTEQPWEHYEYIVDERDAHVVVADSEGFVVHECSYFPTLEAVVAAGVSVNLIQ